MIKKLSSVAFAAFLLFGGCSSEKNKKKSDVAGMKCGAGKCGANMFDGNKALAKKRKNILEQLREGDLRKDCVLNAKSTKALYDCVRNPVTGRLSLKCGSSASKASGGTMKCGDGKCGASMQKPKKTPKKADTAMKCDGSMDMSKPKKEIPKKKEPAMKCDGSMKM